MISDQDRERSATASGIDELRRALKPLLDRPVRRLLDIGCGFGGLSRLVADEVGADEVHGVDVDGRILEEAASKGVVARQVDVENSRLPYEDGYFDLVISLGMMDYLRSFDPMIVEIRRVLPRGGMALISLPNLGSWHNRLALLFGYQPRDVEVSDAVLAGALPYYRGHPPSGHIHTVTVRAFSELMSFHGFRPVQITGGSWATRTTKPILLAIDRLLSRRVPLARRFFYLGQKIEDQSETPPEGWWQGRHS